MSAHLSASSFAIESMAQSIELHFASDTFLAVPTLVVTRALLEYAATAAWILDPQVSADQRLARNCAASIRAVERSVRELGPDFDGGKFQATRESLLNYYVAAGVDVQYFVDPKTNSVRREVRSVRVGTARAAINYNISQRISKQIQIGDVYGILSSVAHGEQVAIAMTSVSIETQLRAIAFACFRSVEAYSTAVHAYVGAVPGGFINPQDLQDLLATFPHDVQERRAANARRFGGD